MATDDFLPPSPWVVRFSELSPKYSPVLDLACGTGRHTKFFLAKGHPVSAVDRNLNSITDIHHELLSKVELDLETDTPWPLPTRYFGTVVVTNYLYRPILNQIMASVARPGLLIYETFAKGNEKYGRPSNPKFLLEPGELLELVRGHLRVVAYEDVTISRPKLAAIQRICGYLEP